MRTMEGMMLEEHAGCQSEQQKAFVEEHFIEEERLVVMR